MAQEKVNQRMRFIAVVLVVGAVSLLIIPPAGANSPPPVTTLKVFFERDNIPVNQTVRFTVNCSVFDNPRENQPGGMNEWGDLFSYSALCPSYGCFDRLYHYMPYANLTSCDFIGVLDGEQFTLMNTRNPFSCTVGNNWKTQSCELHINLSSAHFTAVPAPAANNISAAADRIVIMETPSREPGENRGIMDDIICFLKSIFGGTCQDDL